MRFKLCPKICFCLAMLTAFGAKPGRLDARGVTELSTSAAAPAGDAEVALPSLVQLLTTSAQPGEFAFIHVPLVRQSRNFTCGAAALQSILTYWEVFDAVGDPFWEGKLAAKENLNSDVRNGTSSQNLMKFIDRLNDPEQFKAAFAAQASDEVDTLKFEKTMAQKWPDPSYTYGYDLYLDGTPRTLDFEKLRSIYDDGYPVLLNIQAWAMHGGDLQKWRDEEDSGHYVVGIGYKKIGRHYFYFFMDPWTTGQYTVMREDIFDAKWHDILDGKTLKRFALVFKKYQNGKPFRTSSSGHRLVPLD